MIELQYQQRRIIGLFIMIVIKKEFMRTMTLFLGISLTLLGDFYDVASAQDLPDGISCWTKKEIEQWRADQLTEMWNKTIRHLPREEQVNWLRKEYNKFDSMKHFDDKTPEKFNAFVKMVEDPQEGLLSKILLIRSAKESIDLAQMIFDSDISGFFVLHELGEALKRGVSIRLVLDPSFSLPTLMKAVKYLLSIPPGEVKDEAGEVVMVKGKKGKMVPKRATIEAVRFNPWINSSGKAAAVVRRFKNIFRSKVNRYDTNIEGDGFNRRMHDKFLGIDLANPKNAKVMIGGRAIQDGFNGISDEEYKSSEWTDMEVIVKNNTDDFNPDANLQTQTQTYFDKVLLHLANTQISSSRSEPMLSFTTYSSLGEKIRKGAKDALKKRPELVEKLKRMEEEDFLNKDFDPAPVMFLNELQNMHKKSAYDEYPEQDKRNRVNGASIMKQVTEEILKAKQKIDIHTPYLYLTPKEVDWLRNWLSEDPTRKLRIVTNSVFTSDGGPPEAITHHVIGPAFMKSKEWEGIRDQVQIYEFGKLDDQRFGGDRKVGRLHGKFVIIDEKVSMVTTHNSAPRSRHLNSENAFMIYSDKFAKKMTRGMEHSIENCHLWGSEEWNKLRHHKEVIFQKFIQGLAYPLMKKFNLIGLL